MVRSKIYVFPVLNAFLNFLKKILLPAGGTIAPFKIKIGHIFTLPIAEIHN
jgi:hypothetical protein